MPTIVSPVLTHVFLICPWAPHRAGIGQVQVRGQCRSGRESGRRCKDGRPLLLGSGIRWLGPSLFQQCKEQNVEIKSSRHCGCSYSAKCTHPLSFVVHPLLGFIVVRCCRFCSVLLLRKTWCVSAVSTELRLIKEDTPIIRDLT